MKIDLKYHRMWFVLDNNKILTDILVNNIVIKKNYKHMQWNYLPVLVAYSAAHVCCTGVLISAWVWDWGVGVRLLKDGNRGMRLCWEGWHVRYRTRSPSHMCLHYGCTDDVPRDIHFAWDKSRIHELTHPPNTTSSSSSSC